MGNNETYDLVVIGGGPAGYAAAIRAGQLGKRVACIEQERAGGTCLNWGCIPSKALLKSAEFYRAMQKADTLGFQLGKIEYDFAQVIQRSRGVADQMAKGIEFLFKKNKVDYLVGKGQINVPGMVEVVEGRDKGRYCKTDNILIATGCRARGLPGLEIDGERVMTSREALVMKQQPKSVAVLGAGAIGSEFAYFLNAFGTKVTLVEMLPRVLPVEDEEVSRLVGRSFKKQGMDIWTSTRAENIQVGKKSVKLELKTEKGKTEELEVETLILGIGVVPNLEKVASPKVRLATDEKGYLQVGDDYQTNQKGVYGAGDIIGPPWLAHVATYEAVQAVNGMFGHSKPKRVRNFPSCTYCQPQVGSIGLTEQAAKEQGLAYKVGKFPFTASGKAVASNESEGFVKILVGETHGEILGAHIVGNEATELIAEYGLALNLEATVEEIHGTIHAHPTLAEALGEAAADTQGEAIHI